MPTLPAEIMVVMQAFAPVFSERIWDWVQVLVLGAILAPRQRTVCAAVWRNPCPPADQPKTRREATL